MNSLIFKRISTWGKFVGILTMIVGGLSALSGLPFFLIGAIPGLIVAWLGYVVFKSGQEASAFLTDHNEVHIEELLNAYGKLLKFYGLYTVIMFVLAIPIFFITLFLGLLA